MHGQVPVDELVETLWPEAGPGVGRTRLRNVLSRVRETVGDLVARDGDLVRLAVGTDVDARRFEEQAAKALAASTAGDPAAVEMARVAVASSSGELLPGDRFAAWTTVPRERLSRWYLALIDVLIDDAVATDRPAEAVRLLEEAIALDRYEEDRYARAARILVGRGWRSRASAMVRRARAVAAELGVPVGDAVLDLERELLTS
jgi:DNA-binding SARP family transcriptional activator